MYYIEAKDISAEDLSGFVEAETLEQAIELWKEWLTSFTDNEPLEPRYFRLPTLTGQSRALMWHVEDGGIVEL
jgi:hypothetical protein